MQAISQDSFYGTQGDNLLAGLRGLKFKNVKKVSQIWVQIYLKTSKFAKKDALSIQHFILIFSSIKVGNNPSTAGGQSG